jgi:hypothetical protein
VMASSTKRFWNVINAMSEVKDDERTVLNEVGSRWTKLLKNEERLLSTPKPVP